MINKSFNEYKNSINSVLKNVSENATMVGNPAKNINTKTSSSFKPYGVDD